MNFKNQKALKKTYAHLYTNAQAVNSYLINDYRLLEEKIRNVENTHYSENIEQVVLFYDVLLKNPLKYKCLYLHTVLLEKVKDDKFTHMEFLDIKIESLTTATIEDVDNYINILKKYIEEQNLYYQQLDKELEENNKDNAYYKPIFRDTLDYPEYMIKQFLGLSSIDKETVIILLFDLLGRGQNLNISETKNFIDNLDYILTEKLPQFSDYVSSLCENKSNKKGVELIVDICENILEKLQTQTLDFKKYNLSYDVLYKKSQNMLQIHDLKLLNKNLSENLTQFTEKKKRNKL